MEVRFFSTQVYRYQFYITRKKKVLNIEIIDFGCWPTLELHEKECKCWLVKKTKLGNGDFEWIFSWIEQVRVIVCCILMDLKIWIKSSIIGFMIFKSVLKLCVIGLMIYKFYIKSSVIQSYGFTNKFDFIMDLNRFFFFWLKIQRLKSEGKPPDL